jgi:hypothetical protein
MSRAPARHESWSTRVGDFAEQKTDLDAKVLKVLHQCLGKGAVGVVPVPREVTVAGRVSHENAASWFNPGQSTPNRARAAGARHSRDKRTPAIAPDAPTFGTPECGAITNWARVAAVPTSR